MSLITRGLGGASLIARGLGGSVEQFLFSGLRVYAYDDQSRVTERDNPERLSFSTRSNRVLIGASNRGVIIDNSARSL